MPATGRHRSLGRGKGTMRIGSLRATSHPTWPCHRGRARVARQWRWTRPCVPRCMTKINRHIRSGSGAAKHGRYGYGRVNLMSRVRGSRRVHPSGDAGSSCCSTTGDEDGMFNSMILSREDQCWVCLTAPSVLHSRDTLFASNRADPRWFVLKELAFANRFARAICGNHRGSRLCRSGGFSRGQLQWQL